MAQPFPTFSECVTQNQHKADQESPEASKAHVNLLMSFLATSPGAALAFWCPWERPCLQEGAWMSGKDHTSSLTVQGAGCHQSWWWWGISYGTSLKKG